MTNKAQFIETMDAIIDYCESAKGMNFTEEEYGKLTDAASSAQAIMYGIVEGTEEVLKGEMK
jgi:hypothetical protein